MEESGISDEEMEEEWFVLFNTTFLFTKKKLIYKLSNICNKTACSIATFGNKALIKLYTHWYLTTQLRRVLMRSIESKQHYLIKIKSFISEWYRWSPPRPIKLIYAFSTKVPLSLQLCSIYLSSLLCFLVQFDKF